MEMNVSVKMLGPLQVEVNDAELALSGRKIQAIFSLLALRAGGNVRRDELIEELELSGVRENAINAVHAHVSRLRRSLNGHRCTQSLLQSVAGGYRLNIDRLAVDAHRFSTEVERALALAPSAPSVVATMLEDALKMWRGETVIDAGGGPLITAAADELSLLRTAAREALLDAWAALNRHQQIIVHARRYIGNEPFNERMRAQLITALKQVGRHAEAFESYYQAERIFNDELGVDPGRDLRAALIEA